MDSQHPMADLERERFDAMLDAIYEDFVGKVAAGRDLTFAAAEALARGRVWAGSDAHERGLVDALGGLRVAIDLARAAAGLDAAKPYRVGVVPPPKSPLAAVLDRGGRDDEPLRAVLEATAPLAEVAAESAATAGQGILSTPGLRAEL
jgi:protease-4